MIDKWCSNRMSFILYTVVLDKYRTIVILTELKRADRWFLVRSLQLLHDSCHGRYRHLMEKTICPQEASDESMFHFEGESNWCSFKCIDYVFVFLGEWLWEISVRRQTLRINRESWLRLLTKNRTAGAGSWWSSLNKSDRKPIEMCSNFQGLEHQAHQDIRPHD